MVQSAPTARGRPREAGASDTCCPFSFVWKYEQKYKDCQKLLFVAGFKNAVRKKLL
jgi:hypothetical protein